MWLRPALPAEAPEITRLVPRSKAHWGYGPAILAACAEALTLRPDEIVPRRVTVAEDDTGLLGVVCLDGAPPHGAVGLLFVEPAVIRRGIGRTLCAHVLDTARGLGFQRLTIDPDPHAEPFYLAQGARPAPAGPAGLEAVVRPRSPWAQAWTGGRRSVHLGNAGEFQAQFGGTAGPATRSAAAHYSCLAALAGPHPAAVVLPAAVPAGWIDMVARRLGWARVEVYDGLTESELLDRPALVRRLRSAGPAARWPPRVGARVRCGRPRPLRTPARARRRRPRRVSRARPCPGTDPGPCGPPIPPPPPPRSSAER